MRWIKKALGLDNFFQDSRMHLFGPIEEHYLFSKVNHLTRILALLEKIRPFGLWAIWAFVLVWSWPAFCVENLDIHSFMNCLSRVCACVLINDTCLFDFPPCLSSSFFLAGFTKRRSRVVIHGKEYTFSSSLWRYLWEYTILLLFCTLAYSSCLPHPQSASSLVFCSISYHVMSNEINENVIACIGCHLFICATVAHLISYCAFV